MKLTREEIIKLSVPGTRDEVHRKKPGSKL
jgi:hypothetical protein